MSEPGGAGTCEHVDEIDPDCEGCLEWLRSLGADLEELEREDAAVAEARRKLDEASDRIRALKGREG